MYTLCFCNTSVLINALEKCWFFFLMLLIQILSLVVIYSFLITFSSNKEQRMLNFFCLLLVSIIYNMCSVVIEYHKNNSTTLSVLWVCDAWRVWKTWKLCQSKEILSSVRRGFCVFNVCRRYNKTIILLFSSIFIFHRLVIVRPIFTSFAMRVYYLHKTRRHYTVAFIKVYIFFGLRPGNTIRFLEINIYNTQKKTKTSFRSREMQNPLSKFGKLGGGTPGTWTC